MKTLQKMREVINSGTAKILTIEAAKQLKGKKILTIYFGYKGQDVVNEFIVDEIISEWNLAANEVMQTGTRQDYWKSIMSERRINEVKATLCLLDSEGNEVFKAHTYANVYNEPTFTGSDIDREVYYIEIDQEVIFTDPTFNNGNFAIVSYSEFHARFALNPGVNILFKGYEKEVKGWIKKYCKENDIQIK